MRIMNHPILGKLSPERWTEIEVDGGETRHRHRHAPAGTGEQADTELVRRVIHQAQQRLRGVHISVKIYSLHEPHVSCIRKGKRARPDEYGTKVVISMDRGGYVVDHQEFATNPYDSELRDEACQRWGQIFGLPAKELGVDRGFHRNAGSPAPRLEKTQGYPFPPRAKGLIPRPTSPGLKGFRGRRQRWNQLLAISKADHRMDRCRYKGFEGWQKQVKAEQKCHNQGKTKLRSNE